MSVTLITGLSIFITIAERVVLPSGALIVFFRAVTRAGGSAVSIAVDIAGVVAVAVTVHVAVISCSSLTVT